METKQKESQAQFVKELVAKSPSLSRGQIMAQLSRRKLGTFVILILTILSPLSRKQESIIGFITSEN